MSEIHWSHRPGGRSAPERWCASIDALGELVVIRKRGEVETYEVAVFGRVLKERSPNLEEAKLRAIVAGRVRVERAIMELGAKFPSTDLEREVARLREENAALRDREQRLARIESMRNV